MKYRRIFITGTGTDVGKTVIAAALVEGLLQQGVPVRYWKPLQAGLPADGASVAGWVSGNLTVLPDGRTYRLPASPDQAAQAEGLEGPEVADLVGMSDRFGEDPVILEGAGGLMVPFNQAAETWADFLVQSGMPVVLCADSGLGTLNHTALTVEALRRRSIDLLAVVLNGPRHQANHESLLRMFPGLPLIGFPKLDGVGSHPQWLDHAGHLAKFITRDCAWHQCH